MSEPLNDTQRACILALGHHYTTDTGQYWQQRCRADMRTEAMRFHRHGFLDARQVDEQERM